MRVVVTRDDYFAAALDLLAREGHARLRIGRLCSSLGVTTGSFYHYFGNWDAFVVELLTHWEREKTLKLADAAAAEPDARARVRSLKKVVASLPHEAETAIRAWSHVNPAVAEVQQRVDDERLSTLRSAIGEVVGRGRRAERLAVLGLSLLIGQQQWGRGVDRRELAQLFDEYEALIMGMAASVAS
ncbi:TetR/AcrR family transcriptional regulator [Jatrophihabitans fulvus]